MDLLPSFDARERLLDGLALLGREVGWDGFVANPLLTPEPRWFPDVWSPDRRGVRLLSTRLLRYLALEYDVAVAVQAPPEDHVAAWFSGLDDDTCYFGIDPRQLEREESFVAALCHESCHAFRRHHGIELKNADREEEATDLTAVFLGFGIFLLNASDQFDTRGELVGGSVVSRTIAVRLGYLSSAALAYLLAVQATVRELAPKELKAIAGHLRANQRACFEAALKELRDEAAFLRDRLKMPDRATWPQARTEPHTTDLGIDTDDDDDEEEEDESHAPRDAGNVFRCSADASGRSMFWGLAAGALLGGIVSVKQVDLSSAGRLFLTLLPAVVLALGGRHWGRTRHEDTCSSCEARLHVGEDTCPRCRGRIIASVRSTEARLVAEDLIERKGLDAGLVEFEVERLAILARERTRKVKIGIVCAAVGLVVFALAAFR